MTISSPRLTRTNLDALANKPKIHRKRTAQAQERNFHNKSSHQILENGTAQARERNFYNNSSHQIFRKLHRAGAGAQFPQ